MLYNLNSTLCKTIKQLQTFHMLKKQTKYYSLEIIIQLYFIETIYSLYKNV